MIHLSDCPVEHALSTRGKCGCQPYINLYTLVSKVVEAKASFIRNPAPSTDMFAVNYVYRDILTSSSITLAHNCVVDFRAASLSINIEFEANAYVEVAKMLGEIKELIPFFRFITLVIGHRTYDSKDKDIDPEIIQKQVDTKITDLLNPIIYHLGFMNETRRLDTVMTTIWYKKDKILREISNKELNKLLKVFIPDKILNDEVPDDVA